MSNLLTTKQLNVLRMTRMRMVDADQSQFDMNSFGIFKADDFQCYCLGGWIAKTYQDDYHKSDLLHSVDFVVSITSLPRSTFYPAAAFAYSWARADDNSMINFYYYAGKADIIYYLDKIIEFQAVFLSLKQVVEIAWKSTCFQIAKRVRSQQTPGVDDPFIDPADWMVNEFKLAEKSI